MQNKLRRLYICERIMEYNSRKWSWMKTMITDKQDMIQCYYDIAENCKESIIIFNEAGEIIRCNAVAENETGYEGELTGRLISDIFPELFKIRANRKLEWNIKPEQTEVDTSAYRKNQTCYPVKACLIRKDVKGIAGIIICSDYTEQKEAIWSAKEALDEMEYGIRMRTQFMANITHELRTPVNGMKGMAENLLDTTLSPSQQETVNIIIRNCNNMAKIINDILDFSKMEAGKMTIERRKFNFRKFLDELMTFHLTKINEKGLKLVANIAPDVPGYIIGDEVRLGQVINNLISNAIKFTSVGYIALEVAVNQRSSTQAELFFMVIDTGIGINETEKEKLFQSFSQVDGSITRRFGGTGLGLAICRQLVELMGGQIRVESEKDKGSTFSFSVKVTVAEPEEGEEEPAYPQGRYEYSKEESSNQVTYREIKDDNLTDETENLYTAKDSLEKLKLCVELGTWEKAEEFSGVVKNMIPESMAEVRRKAFRLELTVRKEDHDKTLELAAELETMLETVLQKS